MGCYDAKNRLNILACLTIDFVEFSEITNLSANLCIIRDTPAFFSCAIHVIYLGQFAPVLPCQGFQTAVFHQVAKIVETPVIARKGIVIA